MGGWSLVQPAGDGVAGPQNDSLPSKRPTHVADTDKVGGGHPIGGADLDPEERGLTPKTHRSNAQIIGGLENVLFQMVQSRLGIPVVEEAEKLSFT